MTGATAVRHILWIHMIHITKIAHSQLGTPLAFSLINHKQEDTPCRTSTPLSSRHRRLHRPWLLYQNKYRHLRHYFRLYPANMAGPGGKQLALWPLNLFLILFSITYFYGFAIANGTLNRGAQHAIYMSRHSPG